LASFPLGHNSSASPIEKEYVTNGLIVRYQRTKSTLPTDWQSVPYRTGVNPLWHGSRFVEDITYIT